MRAVLVVLLVLIVVGVGIKLSGGRLPLIDYPIGPIGVEGPGPAMPGVEIEAPGFGDLSAP